jgi:acyl-[acyl-carrier-protein] desaturase
MDRVQDSVRLLHDLEPAVVENLERHLAMAKEWMPHEYVPWSLGRDYADLGGVDWDPEQSRLSPIARTALEVNLLTYAISPVTASRSRSCSPTAAARS